jgi:hypothetical protein
MNWIVTASGAEYSLSPFADAPANTQRYMPVKLDDIAHHLSLLNRFCGATRRPYSVAEHSLVVSDLARHEGHSAVVQFAALMHDAHEAYINDMSSPVKAALDRIDRAGTWTRFERRHKQHLRAHFGLTETFEKHGALIRYYDLVVLATERRDLLPWSREKNAPWAILRDGMPDAIKPADWIDLSHSDCVALTWHDWRDLFLDRAHELQPKLTNLPL